MRPLVTRLAVALLAVAFLPNEAESGGFQLEWVALPEGPAVRQVAGIAVDGPARIAYRYGGSPFEYLDAASPELHRLDLTGSVLRWELVASGGGPGGRVVPHMHVDRPRNRILVLGGVRVTNFVEEVFSDVWAFDPVLGTWSELAPSGAGPDTVWNLFGMAHDRREDRLLYVEFDRQGGPARTWAFDLAAPVPAWSVIEANDPPVGSAFGAAVYDSVGHRLLVLRWGSPDLWALDLTLGKWSLIATGASCPIALPFPAIGFGEIHRRLIAYNRTPSPRVAVYDESGTPGWSLADAPRGPESGGGIDPSAWDPWAQELVLTRSDRSGPELVARLSTDPTLAWPTLHVAGRPFGRRGMAGTVDVAGRWFVHVGWCIRAEDCASADSCLSSRLAVIEAGDHVTFEPGPEVGPGPAGLEAHSAVWDSIGQRVLFFGGRDEAGTLRNEVWALETSGGLSWEALATNVPGPPRAAHGAAFDRVARRMYVVSGDGPSGPSNELWSLDVGAVPAVWTLLSPTMPATRMLGAGYDRAHHRLLLADASRCYAVSLAFEPPAVTTNVDHLTGLPPRHGMMVAFDHRRNLLVCQRGAGDSFVPTTHALFDYVTFGGAFPRVQGDVVERPPGFPSGYALAGYDPLRDRVLLLHGLTETAKGPLVEFYSVWVLQLDPSTPTRLDLVDAVAEGDGIRVRFAGEDLDGSIAVERTRDGVEDWMMLGEATAVGARIHEYLDVSAFPGVAYRYRGRYHDGAEERLTSLSPSVSFGGAAVAPGLALRVRDGLVVRAWPVAFECRLETGGAAMPEVVAVRGRIVARETMVAPAGEMRVRTAHPGTSAPGLYFARLREDGNVVTALVIRL